jgi:hypothetical protein
MSSEDKKSDFEGSEILNAEPSVVNGIQIKFEGQTGELVSSVQYVRQSFAFTLWDGESEEQSEEQIGVTLEMKEVQDEEGFTTLEVNMGSLEYDVEIESSEVKAEVEKKIMNFLKSLSGYVDVLITPLG